MDFLPFPIAYLLAGAFVTLLCFVLLLNVTVYRNRPIHIDFVYVLASRVYDRDPEFARATRTVSFGLLLFAAGLLLALVYLIVL